MNMYAYIIVRTQYGKIQNYLGTECNLHDCWFQTIEHAKLFTKESAIRQIESLYIRDTNCKFDYEIIELKVIETNVIYSTSLEKYKERYKRLYSIICTSTNNDINNYASVFKELKMIKEKLFSLGYKIEHSYYSIEFLEN